jgi:hypothetical protein
MLVKICSKFYDCNKPFNFYVSSESFICNSRQYISNSEILCLLINHHTEFLQNLANNWITKTYIVVFSVFHDFSWEVVFFYIGGIVDHHRFNIIFCS